MRIMFVIHSLGSMGGAEKVLVMLANHFSQKGYQVAILTFSDEPVMFGLHEDITLIQTPVGIGFLRQIATIRNVAKELKADVVVGFVAATNVLVSLAGKWGKFPTIIAEHSSHHRGLSEGRGAIKAFVWKLLRRITYPFSQTLVVLTQEDLPKYRYMPSVKVIQNPLVLSKNVTNKPRENIILGVGRLHPVKGFDLLIEAFAKADLHDWRLIIAGEGQERPKLEAIVKRLGISDRVEMPGLVEDIETLYQQASIFVLSSRSEGFPGALCEAMGHGCACIAFDCKTGPGEIITDGVDGVLLKPEDVIALQEAIVDLAQNASQRSNLGREALKIRKRLDIATIASYWEETFKRAL